MHEQVEQPFSVCTREVPTEPRANVGDILWHSWGYDQTNIDWYQVVSVGKATIKIQEIHSKTIKETGFMSGHSEPKPGAFKPESKPMLKHPYTYEGRIYVRMQNGSCQLWDGKPKACSWYA